MLWREGLPRPVVVARHNRELGPKAIARILSQAGLTTEQFLSNL
jgi:hypothetical protein